MRTTYNWDPITKSFVPVGKDAAARKHFHSVIQDSMNPTWHPANGKIIDSKAKFRRITKDAGCIEIGNEEQKQRPPQSTDADYEKAIIKAYENPHLSEKSIDSTRNIPDNIIRDAIEKARSELNK